MDGVYPYYRRMASRSMIMLVGGWITAIGACIAK